MTRPRPWRTGRGTGCFVPGPSWTRRSRCGQQRQGSGGAGGWVGHEQQRLGRTLNWELWQVDLRERASPVSPAGLLAGFLARAASPAVRSPASPSPPARPWPGTECTEKALRPRSVSNSPRESGSLPQLPASQGSSALTSISHFLPEVLKFPL